MSSSDRLEAFELPALGGVSTAAGEVAGDGRWSPPQWTGAAPPPPPPEPGAEAFARGVEAGRREGERRAEDDLRPLLKALQAAAERLEQLEAVFVRDREQAITLLAMAVARQLFQREVAVNPEIVTGLVQKAIELLPHEAPIEVRLHPDDLDALRAAGEAEPTGSHRGGLAVIEWIADPALERGDCVAESAARLVDGRADVALRAWCERLTHE
jgi:flagellar assembly protein FliH